MNMEIDLDINNYELNDIYNLFQIQNQSLTSDSMKQAKQIVLKMHPDKSKLHQKYFLFFSGAYKVLHKIYEFQNKSTNKKLDGTSYYKDEYNEILHDLFDKKKELKSPQNFNKWFNAEFEKRNKEDESSGYGDWLKSDECIFQSSSVSPSMMHEEFEKQKKKIQSLTTYTGINDPFASTLGGSLLGKNDDFSSGLFNDGLQYQDLRQAHLETVIPVTLDDYQNIPKFSSEQEYKAHRDRQDINPMTETEALRRLKINDKNKEEESSNLAFYYAKQNEQSQKQNKEFWSGLKHLTNGK